MNSVTRKLTFRPQPRRTVIQRLVRLGKGVFMRCPHPSHRLAEPTIFRIHISHNECRNPGHAPLYLYELPCLRHSNRLRQRSEVFSADIVIRLHVRVDNSEGLLGAPMGEFNTEPAFRHEGVNARIVQEWIEPGFAELPISGAPGDSEARTENGGDVVLAGGPEECPAVGCENSGPC